jgi:hypothetical protein
LREMVGRGGGKEELGVNALHGERASIEEIGLCYEKVRRDSSFSVLTASGWGTAFIPAITW